jgi:hypothetical protein
MERVAYAKPVRFLAYDTLSCYRRLVMRRLVSRLPSKRDQDKNQAIGSLVSWSLVGGEDFLKFITLLPRSFSYLFDQIHKRCRPLRRPENAHAPSLQGRLSAREPRQGRGRAGGDVGGGQPRTVVAGASPSPAPWISRSSVASGWTLTDRTEEGRPSRSATIETMAAGSQKSN